MKNLLLIFVFCLGINTGISQSKEEEKSFTRVEKIYDENGELTQSDSMLVARDSRLKDKLEFYVKKDTTGLNKYFQFPDHFFDLEMFKDKYNLDSIIEQHHHTINYKLKKLEKEALLNLQNLKNEMEWEERQKFEFLELKKHLEALDSLIELKTKQIEDSFKSFKKSKKEKRSKG